MKKLIIFLILTSQCFGAYIIINSFNAGELTPLLEGRTDVGKYYSGCRTLENFIVLSQGAATRRPGLKFITEVKDSTVKTRLLSFEFSITQAYIIEAGNLYFRFYMDGGQILNGGDPYEIVTPYLTADLFELQYIQSADTMYIVHPEYAPRTLTRADHDDWTLAKIAFKRGPFLDENTTAVTLDPDGTSGSIGIVASSATFNANHVGAHFKITHTVDATNTNITLIVNGEQNSSSVTVQLGRTIDFSTHGTWSGTITLQRSFDSGSIWKDVRPVHYESDGNITFTDIESVDDAIYRINKQGSAITSGTCNANLIARSFDVDGVVEITAFTNDTTVIATVENTLGDDTAVTTWSEGAWSDDEGWPSAIAFYEERQVYAATINEPQRIWLSQTNDWPNFLAGTDDASSMSYTIAADQVNTIRWLMPQNALLIGTVGGEWKLSASDTSAALTPTNVSAKRQSSYGSAYLQPAMLNNVILYAQRQARKIRELVFSFEQDSWVSPDLTVLSEHITESGIIEMAFQKTPDPTLWCVRDDGELVGMTYLREQDVVGWHRHVTDGDIESVAVIPGDGESEVWVIVERTIDGSVARYIEQMQPRRWAEQEDAFLVDSGLTFDGGAAIDITRVSGGNPGVVTAASHGFNNGDQVRIFDVGGMVEVNNQVYTVSNAATDTFEIQDSTGSNDIDASGFTAYTTGGEVEQVENRFTTLSHLEGETVDIQADGGFYGTEKVSSGIIVLDEFFNTVHAGLPYTSRLKPMKIELPSYQTIQGVTKRISSITLRFYKTLGAKVGDSWTNYDPVIFRDAADPLEAATPVFSGDKQLPFVGGHEMDGNIFIQQTEPLPFTLLAIVSNFEVGSR